MKKINFTVILLIAFMIVSIKINAQALGYNNNRIAYSSDGNSVKDVTNENQYPTADPDDWCGSPMSLAIIAKKNLQSKLVHFSYNNFMASPPETDAQNQMKKGVAPAISNFGYNPAVFFDVSSSMSVKVAAINQLKLEMEKSTATDPLYFILAGPSEFFYQCVQGVVNDGKTASLAHVYIISHSGYNENEKRRFSHHTLAQARSLGNNLMKYQKIVDQNTGLKRTTYNPYFWLRDQPDTKMRFIFDRMKAHPGNVADPSDSGMTFYLLTNDQNGTPSKLQTYFGNGIITNNVAVTGVSVNPTTVTLNAIGANQTLTATVNPSNASNKSVSLSSSNTLVATVNNNGVVSAVSNGTAIITVKTIDGNKTATCTINVTIGSNSSKVVHMVKRNVSGFAIDGNNGATNGQKVYLYNNSNSNINQLWNEIDHGNGYYSYQKKNTLFCLDGGSGGANGQLITLYQYDPNNQNQQWKKVAVGPNSFRLEKRNSAGFSIDGGNGGANLQNIYLNVSNNANQNQHWTFETIANRFDNENETAVGINPIVVFPNPAKDIATIKGLTIGEKILITDILGKTILNTIAKQENEVISTTGFKSGMYIVSVGEKTRLKLVKE
jgi:uncharacterized protein YjdB